MIDVIHIGVYDRQMHDLGIEGEVEVAMAAIDYAQVECIQNVKEGECIVITNSGNEYYAFHPFAELLRQWMISKQRDHDKNHRTDPPVNNNGTGIH